MINIQQINTKHKEAFAMITAIFVIVIMATVTSLIMNVTGKTVKETTQQYQKEQAQLLARSYTELAIFKVLDHNKSACITSFNDHFGEAGANGYNITVNIKYIGNDTLLNGCTQTILADATVGVASMLPLNPLKRATWTANSLDVDKTISLVIDTYITYKDFDDLSNRDITFHRRTLQKL